jgi:hypothetical protein
MREKELVAPPEEMERAWAWPDKSSIEHMLSTVGKLLNLAEAQSEHIFMKQNDNSIPPSCFDCYE